MDNQDKDFMAKFLMVLGALVLLTVAVFIIANVITGSSKLDEKELALKNQFIEERIQKVGKVNTEKTQLTDAAAGAEAGGAKQVRTAQEIVTGVCAACHNTGVLQAPKLDVASDWEPRMASGFDALVQSSIQGKAAMPPKGGDASLSEDDMKKAVAYMLKSVGLSAPEFPEEASSAPVAEAQTLNPVAGAIETATDSANDAVTNVTETASAAVATVATTAAAVGSGMSNAVDSAAQAVAEKTAPVSGKGKSLYKTACFACHDTGVSNAPKLGDIAAWVPRIANGAEALYQTAINGKGAMPPKGGRLDLTDDDIKQVVDFMISESQ